ncbi:flagellinolysin [Bacillus sp. JJ1521]|uniref:flagellinolysin n=1 Tax=Bacillus sp. JJ1521 TaxID=3122957 RepID=UPI003000701C
MRITHNLTAINAHRLGTNNLIYAQSSLEKLSSGYRINRAADDAAGLAISEKMRNQLRGIDQATRNTLDGISLLQTAEGGLQEIHSLLSRGRELVVQAANSTYTQEDKQKMQAEISQLNKEIDNITINTHFNNRHILNSVTFDQAEVDKVVAGLQQGGWLAEAVNRVESEYGLTADNVQLTIKFDQGAKGGTLAFVRGYDRGTGKLDDLELHIDLSDFIPVMSDDGGTAPMYNDRIIAHEMVHAIMGRTMNFTALPKWFTEGVAEFIHGADERLDSEDGVRDGAISVSKMNEMINRIGDGTDAYWGQTSLDYSMGYTAVRYIHEKIKDAGDSAGIRTILQHLDNNESDDLDDALRLASSGAFTGLNDFVTKFKADAKNLFIGGNDYKIDLTNTDTGAIGGLDADGGGILTAESIIEETGSYTSWTADTTDTNFDVVNSFTEKWDYVVTSPPIILQVGANAGETITIDLVDVTSSSLGVSGVDVVNSASEAIGRLMKPFNLCQKKEQHLGLSKIAWSIF